MRRLVQGIVVLLGLTLLTYALERALPGGPARAILGRRASRQAIAAFNHANELDRPVLVGYVHYLGRLLHGDLGFSYVVNRSVRTTIAQEAPRDVVLVGGSLLIALALAIPTGILQASRRNGAGDRAASTLSFLIYSLPAYALGLILIELLAIEVQWLPPEGSQEVSVLTMLRHPASLALPVLTLALGTFAFFTRYVRSAAVDVLASDFVRTARAKGVPERTILRTHVLRNSLVPVVTLVGLSLPAVFTAGLIVEDLFNFPGVGLQYYTAATQDDFPMILGITLLVGAITVVATILADLAYAWLDPRVRYR